jgi:hypothetical protein
MGPPQRNHVHNGSVAGTTRNHTGPPRSKSSADARLCSAGLTLGTVLDHAELAELATEATLGKRDADRRLVYIHPI